MPDHTPKTIHGDGPLTAATLGHFIETLVDSGTDDPAVIYRITEDHLPDWTGKHARTIELTLIPNGQVLYYIDQLKPTEIHKTLQAFIRNGIVT
jgi:hypothetical protein